MALADMLGGSGWNQTTGLGEIEFALKHFYLPGMEDQKNNARVLLANLERNSKDVSGDFAFVPILLGRNWGIGMRSNRAALPDAGAQRGARAQIPMKYAFGRLAVTLHAMAATKNTSGSYDQVIDVETEGLMEDLPKDINRQFFLDGTGRIGKINQAVPLVNLILDNSDLDAPRSPSGGPEFTKYFEAGMKIDAINPGTGLPRVVANPYVVQSVTNATTIVVDNVTAMVDNDWLCLTGNYNQEITGLLAMTSSAGIYQGVNRATAGNERWKSNEVLASGATLWTTTVDLQEADMQTTFTSIEKASGQAPNIIIGTYEARDKYASLLQTGVSSGTGGTVTLSGGRRFVNTLEYKGGFKGPEFHGIGFIPDTEAPRGYLWFLNMNQISLYEQAGLQFMDDDGAILARVSNYAAYEATLYWFFEMGCRRSNTQGRLKGINQ